MDLIKENLSLLIKVFVGAVVLTLSAPIYSAGEWVKPYCDSFLNDQVVKSPNPDELTGAATTCNHYFYKQYEDQKISKKKYEDLMQDLNFALANKLDQINKYNAEFLSHVRTAKQDCDDDIATSQTADLNELSDYFTYNQIALTKGYVDSSAVNLKEYMAVGQLYSPKRTGEEGNLTCNISYVVFPNGVKAWEAPSHCFHKNGRIKKGRSYSDFDIFIGHDTRQPLHKLKIDKINCLTRNPYKRDYEYVSKDSCLITVKNQPSNIEPLPKMSLTINKIKKLMSNNSKLIGTVGFHPANKNRRLTSYDNRKKYDSSTTKTSQVCNIVNYDRENSISNVKVFMTDCDALGGTSGAPLLYYDFKTKKEYVIGIVGGDYGKLSSDKALNASGIGKDTYIINTSYDDFITN